MSGGEACHATTHASPVLLATRNPAKARRLRELCEGLGLSVRDGTDLPDPPQIDEAGATHLANAVRKAVGWSRAYGCLSIASDGGLVIPALGNAWESTLTHRATGADVPDEERARRLLARMRELVGVRREAYWAEAIAVARGGVVVGAWEVDGLRGVIGESYRPEPGGTPGFWADALWETPNGRKRWEIRGDQQAGESDPWSVLAVPVRDVLQRMGLGGTDLGEA
jgi:inosine/xanthosine triphosphate pyrophosphatase family protein